MLAAHKSRAGKKLAILAMLYFHSFLLPWFSSLVWQYCLKLFYDIAIPTESRSWVSKKRTMLAKLLCMSMWFRYLAGDAGG